MFIVSMWCCLPRCMTSMGAYETWRDHVREGRELKVKTRKIVQRLKSGCLVRCLELWGERAREQRQHTTKARKVVTRLMQRALVEAYETWREHVREERCLGSQPRGVGVGAN